MATDPARNSIEPANVIPETDLPEWQKQRRQSLRDAVLSEFSEREGQYSLKTIPGTVAFTDHRSRIASEFDSSNIAKAMARVAESKGWEGWEGIRLTGNDRFYEVVEQSFEDSGNELLAEIERREKSTAQNAGLKRKQVVHEPEYRAGIHRHSHLG